MSIVADLFLLAQVASGLASPATANVSPPPVSPTQPPLAAPAGDIASLDELPLQRRWPKSAALSAYVRDEVRAGRCAVPGNNVRVELVVQVAGNGQIRRIRPIAIQCPTVEQYASGLMSRMARGNVAPPGEERWYRTALDFAW